MAKNKGTYGNAKSEVEVEDEFVSNMSRLGQKLAPHSTKIAVLVAVVLLGASGWATWDWWQTKQTKKATDGFASAADLLHAGLGEAPPRPGDDRPLPKEPRFPTPKERGEAVLSAVAKIGSGDVGSSAKLVEADALMDVGRFDDAAAAYQAFAKTATVPTLRAIALEGVGYALEAKARAQTDEGARKAGFEAALTAFSNMQPDAKGPRREYAEYHQARMLTAMGKQKEANEKLQALLDGEPGDLAKNIEARLAQSGGAAPAPTEKPLIAPPDDGGDPEPGEDESPDGSGAPDDSQP